ncbi:HAD family hydrolase [Bacteriovoracales bacterium]|nr:HAD family hydrolase [Bacteriovoracales bacterium]
MIKGISFDFWDTLFVDDSDEIERRSLGLPTKKAQKLESIWNLVKEEEVPYDHLTKAFKDVDSWFKKKWDDECLTVSVEVRLKKIMNLLNVDMDSKRLANLIDEFENMEVDISPQSKKGCEDTLRALGQRYKLCLISDTIYTPGKGIREILKKNNMLKYFTSFSFSDEVGASKPSPIIFDHALECLELGPSEVVHVGDRESKDIIGAKEKGMRAILISKTLNLEVVQTAADGKISSLEDLIKAIDKIT